MTLMRVMNKTVREESTQLGGDDVRWGLSVRVGSARWVLKRDRRFRGRHYLEKVPCYGRRFRWNCWDSVVKKSRRRRLGYFLGCCLGSPFRLKVMICKKMNYVLLRVGFGDGERISFL